MFHPSHAEHPFLLRANITRARLQKVQKNFKVQKSNKQVKRTIKISHLCISYIINLDNMKKLQCNHSPWLPTHLYTRCTRRGSEQQHQQITPNMIAASILRKSIFSFMLCSHTCRTVLLWVTNKSEKTQTPFSAKFQWADAHSLQEKFPPSKSLQRDTCLLLMDYGINKKAQCKSNANIIYSNLANCAVFQCNLISHYATGSVWRFWIP